MTLDEVNAASDDLDRQIAGLRDKKRALADRRRALVAEANAEAWGLTVERYDAAKAEAREKGEPLAACLNRARARLGKELRAAQTARAGVADLTGEAKGA
jgi:F0F1-type ATP synthase membrane subunit b/b'